MDREEILAILENEELDDAEKVERIMGICAEDMDALSTERDVLRAEKDERAIEDRFRKAMESIGGVRFKNSFTRDGVKRLFREEIAKPENAGARDSDIARQILSGHESEYLDSTVSIRMTPHNSKSREQAELDEIAATKYKGNPWLRSGGVQ